MNKTKSFLLAVAAMAFTHSCSTSDIPNPAEGEGNSQSYTYCLISEYEMCLDVLFISKEDCLFVGGNLSNNCPYNPPPPQVEPSSVSAYKSSSSLITYSSSSLRSSASNIASSSGVRSSSSQSISSSSVRSSSSQTQSSSSVSSSSSSSDKYGILYDSRDGKTYKTVTRGSLTWMAENLSYNASGSECYDCATYGRLYDFVTAMNLEPRCYTEYSPNYEFCVLYQDRSVCPSGWHIPTTGEWNGVPIENITADVSTLQGSCYDKAGTRRDFSCWWISSYAANSLNVIVKRLTGNPLSTDRYFKAFVRCVQD